jgi:3-dehydroquinate synthase
VPDSPTSPGSAALTVRHAAGVCPIHIGAGLLSHLPAFVARYLGGRRIAVISDATVAEMVRHGLDASVFTFPAGESSKTRATWADLTDRILAMGYGRDAGIVALGGGVTGDLAGFVAATCHRGVPLLQVPTSLLAMVDASIGGKTGVDVPAGKNLVGAFHQPEAVVVDPGVLGSLPVAQWREGLAEVVKHALIADPDHFAQLEASGSRLVGCDPGTIEPVIRRSVAIKATIVEADEREAGRRAVLNAGHTVAHALEQVTGYAISHGQAVAIGLVAECGLGEAGGRTAPGTTERVRSLLNVLDLPTRLPPGIQVNAVVAAMASDKKNRGGEIRFSIAAGVGAMAGDDRGGWTLPFPVDQISRGLAAVA